MRLGSSFLVGLVALSGCEDVIDLDPADRRAPVEASVRPKPISGGTLVVTSDDVAVAADPDRDLVHLVDLITKRVRHTVALEPGDEPGRVVQGSGSQVHVVLRGFGGIATLHTGDGTVLARTPVCPDPRGIAFDASQALLHVACADGTLATLAEATPAEPTPADPKLAELERTRLEPDLRDVMVVDGRVLASQLREASLIDAEGRKTMFVGGEESVPTVAWRTWADADGQILMLHQLSATRPIPTAPKPEEGSDVAYGGSGFFCEPGITSVALTVLSEGVATTTTIPGAPLTVDAAISPEGWIALAMPGAAEGSPTVGIVLPATEGCTILDSERTEEQITAVAFSASGTLVMQSREPARLLLQRYLPNGEVTVVELEGEPRYDTGHEIFHRVTDSGLSCASCHPEGADDGHVWQFEGLGLRRTQPLDVGLEGTAPFHWDGEMDDLDVLMSEVLTHRMGGKRQTRARGESFTRWLFAQQRPPARTPADDPALVEEGQTLFAAYDCGRCHTGTGLGGAMTTPIRGIELQVPSLRRVSLHPPFMHDGRSPGLEAAVIDMIQTTTTTAEPADADVQALAAYLRTL